MQLRAIVVGFICTALALPALAQGPRRAPASGFAPKAPKLTRTDVERLIALLPELAKQAGELESDPTAAMRPGAGGMGNLPVQDLQRVEQALKKHGYTFPVFLMHLTALMSTYLALQPEEFDKQLPTEDSPDIKKVLDDPKVAPEKKAALKKQIKEAQANKELIRQQVTAFATEENKKVVRPLLSKVQKALESAEREANKARAKSGK